MQTAYQSYCQTMNKEKEIAAKKFPHKLLSEFEKMIEQAIYEGKYHTILEIHWNYKNRNEEIFGIDNFCKDFPIVKQKMQELGYNVTERTDIPNQKTVITISWYEQMLQGCTASTAAITNDPWADVLSDTKIATLCNDACISDAHG